MWFPLRKKLSEDRCDSVLVMMSIGLAEISEGAVPILFYPDLFSLEREESQILEYQELSFLKSRSLIDIKINAQEKSNNIEIANFRNPFYHIPTGEMLTSSKYTFCQQ